MVTKNVRPSQIPAGMSHLGLSTSPIFNNVLLNDSILLKVLSLLLAGFSSSSVISHLFLAEGLFKKAISLPLSMNRLPIPFVFPTCTAPDHFLTTFAYMPKAGSGPINGSEETCLASWWAILFPSNPRVSEHPYQLTLQLYVKQQSGTSHNEIYF